VKLLLVLLSLGVIWKGVMSSGDPGGFYSSTCVMYAMLLLDYYTDVKKFKHTFLLTARGIMMFLSGVSVLGIINILTIVEENNQYYIAFDKSMKLSESGIVNIHWVFVMLGVLALLMAGAESVFKISENINDDKGKKAVRKVG
jgi:hypothetical protein